MKLLILLLFFVSLRLAAQETHKPVTNQITPPAKIKSYSALPISQVRDLAQKGDAGAQYNLGWRQYQGEGVPKDVEQALAWLNKSANQNYAKAFSLLGSIYASGDSVPKDIDQAVKWFRKAADQNDPKAQCNLGLLYAEGDGVSKNLTEAAQWYRKAADQNVAEAQYNLGVMYDDGEGVPVSAVEAAKWYRKAAEQNHPEAQCNLAISYAKGQGVLKDLVQAYAWWCVASIKAEDKVRQDLEFAEKQMSPDQIAEGKRLASELFVKLNKATPTR